GASGLAVGVLLGGVLTTASWRLTFVINVPVTVLCALGAVILLGPARDHVQAGTVPTLGSVLGTGTVLALVLGLTFGAQWGWNSAPCLSCLGLALAGCVGFVRNERSARGVLIDPVLRRIRSLRVAAVATALYMASVGSEFYLLTLALQVLKGYPPLLAGMAFLPLALMVTVGSTTAGRAVRRCGAPRVLAGGFAVSAAGLLWLAFMLPGDSYAGDLLVGLLLSGFGHGAVYTSMFVIGTHDVPAARQGTAGALLTTSQYVAGALTVAVLTLVLGSSPDDAHFQAAFLLTAVAAASGFGLAVGMANHVPFVRLDSSCGG
ncbi:MAG: MFS transporter, partial [Kutzneria sp.]|nr:MFS transporter [Kutzneria sp.]